MMAEEEGKAVFFLDEGPEKLLIHPAPCPCQWHQMGSMSFKMKRRLKGDRVVVVGMEEELEGRE